MMLSGVGNTHGAGSLGCFPSQGCRARQCLRPGGKLNPDEERSIRLNARAFQKTLIREAQSKDPIRAKTQDGTRFALGRSLEVANPYGRATGSPQVMSLPASVSLAGRFSDFGIGLDRSESFSWFSPIENHSSHSL